MDLLDLIEKEERKLRGEPEPSPRPSLKSHRVKRAKAIVANTDNYHVPEISEEEAIPVMYVLIKDGTHKAHGSTEKRFIKDSKKKWESEYDEVHLMTTTEYYDSEFYQIAKGGLNPCQ